MPHDVFVSYSKKNKVTADAVCARLEQSGVRCWIAPRDVMPGEPWGGAIVRAISGARVMVLVLSEAANESQQVWHEVERAVDKGLLLIPLRIEDVVPSESLEYYISATHWLDAWTAPLEAHLDHLTGVVQRSLEGNPEAAATPPPPPTVSTPPSAPPQASRRRRLPLLLLLLGLLALGTGILLMALRPEEPRPTPVAGDPGGGVDVPQRQDERASATWWLERAARDGSAFYEDEMAALFWAFAWARACEGERARTELRQVIAKLKGSDAGFIPPGEHSDLYLLLGMAFYRSGCADETESVFGEIPEPPSRAALWFRVATLRHRSDDADGLRRCRAALDSEAAAATDKGDEAILRSTLARVLGWMGEVEEGEQENRAAERALAAYAESSPSTYRIDAAVAALASSLVEAGAPDAAVALVAKYRSPGTRSWQRLHGLLAIVGAADAGVERTLSLLETSDDLAACSLDAYASLILSGGFDDDLIPTRALPYVIAELLRAGRYAHAARVLEQVENPPARLPGFCEIGIAAARRDGPAAGRPWVEKAEAVLDRVDPGGQRDTARAVLIRAYVAVGDRESADRLASLMADLPARIRASSGGDTRYTLLAALATARASLGAWDAIETDLEKFSSVADRMFFTVMVATALSVEGEVLGAN